MSVGKARERHSNRRSGLYSVLTNDEIDPYYTVRNKEAICRLYFEKVKRTSRYILLRSKEEGPHDDH